MASRIIHDFHNKNVIKAGDSLRSVMRQVQGWDVVYDFDDFLNAVDDAEITDRYPAVVTGTDGSIDAVTTGISGEATIDVGDGATSGDNEYGGWPLGNLQYKGDLNAFVVARIKIGPAIATSKVEFGFTDAITGDAGAVNVLATPTATADDCAVWVYDTDDTATWQAFGVKGGGTPLKDENAAIVAPVTDTYQTLGVFLEGDNAIFKQWNANGDAIGASVGIVNAIEGGTAIAPWLFVQNRATTLDRYVTVDWVAKGQRRF